MTAVSKNVYIDKLDDILNEYNNTYKTLNRPWHDVLSPTNVNIGKINSSTELSKTKFFWYC